MCHSFSLSVTFTHQHTSSQPPLVQLATELVAPRRLEERVNGILLRLEKELDQAEAAIGESAVGGGCGAEACVR